CRDREDLRGRARGNGTGREDRLRADDRSGRGRTAERVPAARRPGANGAPPAGPDRRPAGRPGWRERRGCTAREAQEGKGEGGENRMTPPKEIEIPPPSLDDV